MNKDSAAIIESYTAASSFPTKFFHTKVVDFDGKIYPTHIQLSLTNACNLDCKFCSCSDRDKEKRLSYEQVKFILEVGERRGTKAVTITGGGEPLLHPQINEIIEYANAKRIQVGLVTNGILLSKLKFHANLTWCRISSSDDRTPAFETIEKAIKINHHTDFAFSHVVTKNISYGVIRALISFANKHNFTHIRLVSDLLDLDDVPSMKEIKGILGNINDSKVIYQGRRDYAKGTEDCFISLLKPVIAPEGIFPCCGVQYAIHGQPRDMIEKLSMGKIEDLPDILDKQKYFNGRICDVCYYMQYNDALAKLKTKPDHINFV